MSLPRRARGLTRALLLLGVPLAAAVAALHYYAEGGGTVETDNAYVKAHIIAVSAEVAGRVAEVAVRDNQAVAAGQLLFRIDAAPFEVAVARADALLANMRAEVETLRAEYRVALAEAAESEERIRYLAVQLERQRRLKERGMVREEAYDEARYNLDAARARLVSVRERVARVLAGLAGDPQLPAARHPRVLEAQATRDAAALDLARTRVHAPAAGTVSNLKLQPGEHVTRGAAVFSLIQAGERWIEANFKETQLTHMRVGQPARVIADAYPDVEWPARIGTIAPATGAEFALLPPQNATGNWVKIVQRIPVRLEIEPAAENAAARPVLRAGMTVSVSVDTGLRRGLPGLLSVFGR
ncbi:MAG: HlyD family secretion protein [Betaproteobacteria bacterium]|nr:HlyD family secretion protein [Betaproteobacteria bacterium]